MKIGHDITKRFWLFGNRYYYASGGLHDIKFTSQELNEVIKFYDTFEDTDEYEDKEDFYWYIYDSEERTIEELKVKP